MKRLAIAALLLTLAACAANRGPLGEGRLTARANPSDVIATEFAFARAAREKGTWTAFREYATKDAQWPGPQWESVQTALKGVPDPAQAIVWEPDQVWASCDGSFALSTGPAAHLASLVHLDDRVVHRLLVRLQLLTPVALREDGFVHALRRCHVLLLVGDEPLGLRRARLRVGLLHSCVELVERL